MLKKVKLSSLKPNPWRHFETYKIVKEKVETLKESIESTGFWKGQITARPSKQGYEIAWGHHRWMAAKAVLGENAFIEIIVDDLTDDDMLTRMARENNEVYDANASMDIEVVKAALEGSVQGKIHLPKNEIARAQQLKVSDYVECGSSATTVEFSREALVKHLGMKLWRVKTALENLKLVHQNLVDVSDYDDLSPRQAQELAKETRKAAVATRSPEAAKKVSKAVSQTMQKSSEGKAKNDPERGGYRQAKVIAAQITSEAKGENQDLKKFIGSIVATRDKINGARLSLDRLVTDMVDKGVTSVSGTQITSLLKAINDMEEAISYYRANLSTKQANLRRIK